MRDPASLFTLQGRTALVTGASSGIGLAAAQTLAAAGARVILAARGAERLQTAARAIGETAVAIPCDLSTATGIEALTDGLARRGLAPDILINNAGAIDRAGFDDVARADWDRVMALNVTAPMLLAQALVPAMRVRGWGRIVNVASILAIRGKPNAHSYAASKHAIAGLTRSMAAELGGSGICVNALCPGYVRTEINQTLQADPAFTAMLQARVPLGRWGETGDLAGPLLLLASDAASFVNGHLLVVDGGMTATH
ncbi:SDR family NAD(P)-dependent oxidoreductase [Tabrizicola sp. TH137]|uniref:SDR family NAD(P)-dependent oxidoreductase n=1 Tax=Tabrizicola sp. TH137 TaxID=2067452 RepID=UPI001304132B|nr:glucose 1-dehydrogenase [Tabrizicola sp. TH137]